MLLATTARVFPPEMPTPERLRLAAAAGFDGLELNFEAEQGLPLPLAPRIAAALRADCDRLGLHIASVYSRAQWETPLSSPDPDIRARGRRVLEELLAAAQLLGCDAVLVIPGLVDSAVIRPEPRQIIPYAQCYDNAHRELESLVPAAAAAGVTLCLENVGSKFLLDPLSFRDFVDSFHSPAVRAYFDIGNALNYGFPEHWIPVLGPRIHRLHVKDARPSLSPLNAVVNLFDGEVNWPVVSLQLADLGYDGWLTAEVLPPWRHYPERFLAQLRDNLDFLRHQIAAARD